MNRNVEASRLHPLWRLAMFNPFSRPKVPGFNVRPEDLAPGFRVTPPSEAIGFNIEENGMRGQQGTGSGPPQAPMPYGIGLPPPGLEGFAESPPTQLPEWLQRLLAMPLPIVSNAFDPRTGQRIVPYAPLINPAAPAPTTDAATAQVVDPEPAGSQVQWYPWLEPPDEDQQEARAAVAAQQDASGAETAEPTTGAAPTPQGWPAADPNFVLANADGDSLQEAQQQRPLPQRQQTQQKRPPTSSPAPRVPERPGMEMTELERRREEEFAELNKQWFRLKEADRRQPIWDKLTREPPKQTTSNTEFPDLLPDNWEEFLTNKIDPRYVAWTRAAAERNNIPPVLLARLYYQESKYKANAATRQAVGIAQMTPVAIE